MSINPTELKGNWNEGYALDYHLVSSEYVGEDVYGNKRFDNKYTELGELLYKMKYNGHHDTSDDIVSIARPFLDKWLKDKAIDIILPIPPTKSRDIQPIFIIAEAISKCCNVPCSSEVFVKTTPTQSKDIDKSEKDLTGTITLLKNAKRKCNILLIDDLFATGATAAECVKVLKTDSLVDKIYLLALTKTR